MKIIAVDDEKIALKGLLLSIERAAPDANVVGFRYASDAIDYMKIEHCDVAFLDIEMKGINGVELARELKSINPDINIIFSTGFGNYRDVAFDLHASGYLIKPITVEGVKKELDNLRRPVSPPKRLKIKTFGNFEVLYNASPVVFKYQKSKELLAYLIDRRGAMCSTGELMAILFEDDGDHKVYYHKIRSELIDALSAINCENILSQQRGLLGIAVDLVDCDYYDYLNGKIELSNLYHGEYMAQYSFAEITNAELFAKLQRH